VRDANKEASLIGLSAAVYIEPTKVERPSPSILPFPISLIFILCILERQFIAATFREVIQPTSP